MGFRFRKSIKLGKGVKLNLNKKSFGVSVGGKGAHLSVNSKGRKSATVGIPGTGLSYTTRSQSKKKSSSGQSKKRSTYSDNSGTAYTQIPVPNVQTPAPKKEMQKGLVPMLITIFLGWAGVHWFICGRVGMGFLYLFTGGLFGIGWVIDIIIQVVAYVRIVKENKEEETTVLLDNEEGQDNS